MVFKIKINPLKTSGFPNFQNLAGGRSEAGREPAEGRPEAGRRPAAGRPQAGRRPAAKRIEGRKGQEQRSIEMKIPLTIFVTISISILFGHHSILLLFYPNTYHFINIHPFFISDYFYSYIRPRLISVYI